jgi:hypothetical protein
MFQPELPGIGSEGTGALEPQTVSGRLRALLVEHERLLKKIARKRAQVEELQEEVKMQGGRFALAVEPLRARVFALDAEIHALFRELLASRTVRKHARREVATLYQFLRDQEVISADGAAGEESPDFAEPPPEHGGSARPPDRRESAAGIRDLFLGLANLLHPDKAQSAHDLAERTEVMKDVNRAYEDGDLARLLEIERTWRTARPSVAPDELERRRELLERTNAELRAQLKTLTRTEKALWATPVGRLIANGNRPGAPDPLQSFEKQARKELDELVQLRDHLCRFRDGKISVDELFNAPGVEDELAADFEEGLAAAMECIAIEITPAPAPRRRHGRRRKKRR